jgi:hypothetical protein
LNNRTLASDPLQVIVFDQDIDSSIYGRAAYFELGGDFFLAEKATSGLKHIAGQKIFQDIGNLVIERQIAFS